MAWLGWCYCCLDEYPSDDNLYDSEEFWVTVDDDLGHWIDKDDMFRFVTLVERYGQTEELLIEDGLGNPSTSTVGLSNLRTVEGAEDPGGNLVSKTLERLALNDLVAY
ncbi:hypothetical protein DFH28DRAFT_933260 [Melampsora americana]|nr:hypothetical protein DFH28DRAFT_933260 [Melampsora americana]